MRNMQCGYQSKVGEDIYTVIRRVKCDETKPACRRCTDTQRACDFLKPSNELQLLQASRIATKSRAVVLGSNRISTLQPKPAYSPSGPFSNDDGKYFEFFRILCTTSSSRYFEDPLWDKTILQMAQSESSIRNGVLALAVLLHPQNNPSDITIERQKSNVKYLHAIQSLNNSLDTSTASWELALIASLLFTSFEVLRGNPNDTASLQHFGAGQAILKEYISKPQYISGTLKNLSKAFSRFDTQACSFAIFYQSKSVGTPAVPETFETISEARDVIDDIIAYMYRLFKPYKDQYRDLPYLSLPPKISAELKDVDRLLKDWSSTLEKSINGSEPSIKEEAIGVKILRAQHLAAIIYISTHFYRDELAYDAFTKEFTEIILLATIIIDHTQKEQGSQPFSFDLGVIPALYLTATKCRNPVLRRKAIGLLTRSGIEGIWIGDAMAAVARWVVKNEEMEIDEDFVPEEKRLNVKGVALNRTLKRVRIVTTTKDAHGLLHYTAVNVGWAQDVVTGDDSEEYSLKDKEALDMMIANWRRYLEGSLSEMLTP
ncbi:hypothetical protein G7Y89_g6725 [Cudoniella acicularis]|uniref:Zn(2)-C6 fungal-type domain-containing protein n=1 Tax=Cudoniella acicularis TaxID=354080 RepID=A0A8H4RM74_9HELO|nr:hypothetical protein G7Y89_g6725 [Cudoniella acicularis]